MFLMKNRITLFLSVCFTLLLFSCLGGEDTYDYDSFKDPQVYRFHLKSDSVAALDSVKFTIDQLEGKIYNIDSMAYGTKLKDKVFCTFNTRSVYKIQVIQEALRDETDPSKDTIDWNGVDSLDFSKPVIFITHAMDGVTKKKYTAWVNIHQLKPDSMHWEMFKDQMIPRPFYGQAVLPNADTTQYMMYVKNASGHVLYTADAGNPSSWTPVTLNGFPQEALLDQMQRFKENRFVVPARDGKLYTSDNFTDWVSVPLDAELQVTSVLGVIPFSKPVLSLLAKKSGVYTYISTTDLQVWNESEEEVSGRFPVSGFGRCSYTNRFGNGLVVVSGSTADGSAVSDCAWGTEDGSYWIEMTNGRNFFKPRTGAMVTPYDDKFYLIGGLDADGNALKSIYTSMDYGKSWTPVDSMKILPEAYVARGNASVQVNKDKFLFLFGGKESKNAVSYLDQIWKGRINRLVFDQQDK